MPTDRLAGKAMYFTFNSVNIKITKVTPKITRKLADETDTSNYDSATDLIYPSQIPTSTAVELGIEGHYYKAQTPSALIAKLFEAGNPVAATFGPLSGYPHFSGSYDLSDLELTVETEAVVSYKATLKSNGKILPNS